MKKFVVMALIITTMISANVFAQEKNPIKNILTQEPYRLEKKIKKEYVK
ncbi:MAG: hypothetical protein PHS54_06070 [Clostridia bacterium]|nr:hypothetical protein [Clostridia bacterium]